MNLFQRQWAIGSDDMPLPSLVGIGVRLFYAVVTGLSLIAAFSGSDLDHCGSDQDQRMLVRLRWLGGVEFCLYLVSLSLFVLLFVHSLRGTIVDTESRAMVNPLLKLLTITTGGELVVNAFGSILLFVNECPDSCVVETHDRGEFMFFSLSTSYTMLQIVAIAVWVNCVLFFTCGFFLISNSRRARRNVMGGDQYRALEVNDESYSDLEEDINAMLSIHHASDDEGLSWSVTRTDWEGRCKRMCCWFQLITCNIFGSSVHQASDETYRDVANVMARFFKGLDLVPSDLIAALTLLRTEQRSLENNAVQAIIRSQLRPSLRSTVSNVLANSPADRSHVAVGTGSRPAYASPPVSAAASPSTSSPASGSSPFGSAANFSQWLWSEEHMRRRARIRLHVQHFEEAHVAIDDDAKKFLQEAHHFEPYMLGIYGKLLYAFIHTAMAPVKLCCMNDCQSSEDTDPGRMFRRPSFSENIIDDDCCSLNYSALRMSTLGRKKPTIVFASFSNGPMESPYSLAVDELSRTVVLAIRGTLSAADMLIDAIVTPRSLQSTASHWGLDELGDVIGPDSHAHGGMLATALTIRADIERRRILHALLFGKDADVKRYGGSAHLETIPGHALYELPDCRGYKLKLVGHSLGSGIASILSVLLKPLVPDLTVIAYSPPGCIFDYRLAESSSKWVHSVFVGEDMVPRASWRALVKLKAQILDMLRRSKVNKPKAMRAAILYRHADDLLYPENRVPKTFARQMLARKITELRKQDQGGDFLTKTPMYAPGRLLHLMRAESIHENCCRTRDVYVPVWVDRISLDEMIVSRRSALDHFPNVCAEAIEQVAKQHLDNNMVDRYDTV